MSQEITLQPGLRAYPVVLGEQAPGVGWREIVKPTIEEATTRLNDLLQSVHSQGGDIKGFVTVTTGEDSRSPIGGRNPEETVFMIVDKPTLRR